MTLLTDQPKKKGNPNWIKKTDINDGNQEISNNQAIVENTPIVKEETVNVPVSLLERLEKLEKDLASKQDKEESLKDKKKRYEWPRKYHYQIWLGQPVLSYSSKRKDPTKDYVYKNLYWKEESNHYLDLTLADWTIVEAEVNEYNANKQISEKQFCEVVWDWSNVMWYKFNTSDFWTFIVSPSVING